MEDMIRLLAAELGQKPQHVGAVVRLLDEGNTIPFIARYRKEQHGAMDDTTLRTLAERLQYLRNLAQRREEIRRSIAAQEKLTDELDAALQAAVTLSELEDLYRPYKPKRRTRATIARERGLAPLAEQLLGQARDLPDPLTLAAGFADPARGVETPEDALAGASDIVAETVSDDAAVRKALRSLMQRQSVLRTQAAKGKEEETSVYQLYYDFRQPVPRLQGHQILAVNRGEREGFLKVTLETDRDQALICVRRCVLVPGGGAAAFLRAASGPQEPGRVLYYNDQPSDFIYYQGLAQRAMGNEAAARKAFHKLLTYGETHLFDAVAYDFFAVSLPEIEVFADDIALRNRQYCNYLRALGCAGLGRTSEAAELFAGILELQPDDQGALRHA